MKCNKDNTQIINSPEFVILDLIDSQIMQLENHIERLKALQNNIHSNIKKELNWEHIYLEIDEYKFNSK